MSGFDIPGPGSFETPRLLGENRQIDLLGQDGGDREISTGAFSSQLQDALGQVAELSSDVKDKYEALARGDGSVEIHDLMTAIGKSEVAFNLMLEMRNKIVEAWQTLSRAVV